MKSFDYQRAASIKNASELANRANQIVLNQQNNTDNSAIQPVKFIAGGTNLLDLMKHEIEVPSTLIDISRLPLDQIETLPDGGIKIGAMVSNSELAAHPIIRRDYAVLSRALLAGASGQLRNKATTGGNLLQRTRCYYFYQPDSPCNKRLPNSGCPAKTGEHRNLAILGVSEQCIANHPSDMAVAMRLLDAQVVIQQVGGEEKTIAIADLYHLPENSPHIETCLQMGDIITHIILPPPLKGVHSYDKVRDRASYAFALVSVASVIRITEGKIGEIQLAFGGIGSVPWRDETVETVLLDTTGDTVSIELAVATLFKTAKTDEQTEYKTVLVQRLMHHVIRRAFANQANASQDKITANDTFSPVSSGASL